MTALTGPATARTPRRSPIRLRPYQVEVAAAVLDSVRRGLGLTFTVEMARQAGKNELSAYLEIYLLGHMAARARAGGFTPHPLNTRICLSRG